MPSPSPRVISYIRYSTGGQGLGDSEHRQLELAEEYCRANGLTLAPVDVLKDLGMSAYRERTEGAFTEFLAALRAGTIPRGTILIVEAWDRLWRQPPLNSLNEMTEIILKGIKIVTLEHDRFEAESAHRGFPTRACF
jgi:DNA invertase Pin-like site-specific DNA recombinase